MLTQISNFSQKSVTDSSKDPGSSKDIDSPKDSDPSKDQDPFKDLKILEILLLKRNDQIKVHTIRFQRYRDYKF